MGSMGFKRYNVNGTVVVVSFLSDGMGTSDYRTTILEPDHGEQTDRRVCVEHDTGVYRMAYDAGERHEPDRIEAVRRFRLDEYAAFLTWHCNFVNRSVGMLSESTRKPAPFGG